MPISPHPHPSLPPQPPRFARNGVVPAVVLFQAIAFLLGCLPARSAFAQSPLTASLRVRAENWRWFDTPGFDDRYTFVGAQLRLAMTRKLGPYQGTVEAAVPVLWNLPGNAVAPAPRGQLGLGGSYHAANNDSMAAGVTLKQAFLKAGAFRLGRMEFAEGAENVPSDAALAAVRTARVANRLVGTFGFSHVGRSFDGLHFGKGPWTVLAARPTAGVFRVDAGGPLDVDLLYASWVRSSAAADGRVFVIGYRDHRDLTKTDNRPAPMRTSDREDIAIGTIGGHYIARIGAANVLAWGAYQFGDWGRLDHRATAFDLEAATTIGRATLRAGWFRSSGDRNAADRDHETFFQILPTPRVYARTPFYNAMNSNDLFVQATFKPTARLTLQTELHRLALTEKTDLWYAGGGAYDGLTFGYAGRPSNGNDDLATVLDLSADCRLNPKTTVTVYAGRAFGGDVVRALFAGADATFAYVEVTRRF